MAQVRTFAAWRRLAAGAVLTGSFVLVSGSGAGAEPCATPLLGCAPTASTTTTSTTAPESPPPAQPSSPQQPTSEEAVARLVARTNAERTQRGLPALQVREDVASIARGWSDSMARAARLSHNDAYFTQESHRRLDAQLLGENVARAPDVDTAHEALMASEHHRDNILDARFAAVGIGATYVDGSWWITEDFLQPHAARAQTAAGGGQGTPAPPTPRAPRVTRRSTSTTSTSTTSTSTSTTSTSAVAGAEGTGVVAAVAAPARPASVLPLADRRPATVLVRGEPAAARGIAGTVGAAILAMVVIAATGELRRRARAHVATVVASPRSRH